MDPIARLQGMINEGRQYTHDEQRELDFIAEAARWKHKQKINYMQSLLYPEEHLSKIPSMLPVSSAVTSISYQQTITPNASGKFLLVIDPVCQSGFLYQDAGLNGTGGGTLTSLTFAQDANIIDEWRLVSSSVILRYYGNFNNMAGFFVGATASNRDAATQTTFLNFQNIEDLTGKQLTRAVDGMKLIYTPVDTLTQEYSSQTNYSANTHPARWQNLFIIYGDNFPNTSCIRVDYTRNIEYKSKPAYREYIAHTKDLPCEPVDHGISGNISIAPKEPALNQPRSGSLINGVMDLSKFGNIDANLNKLGGLIDKGYGIVDKLGFLGRLPMFK